MKNNNLTNDLVRALSKEKNEPAWMLALRLKALETFYTKTVPKWGADLSELDFNDINYYFKATEGQENSWDAVPDRIKKTFEALGVPQAERSFLAGVGAQFESELVYKNLQKEWQEKGVIFSDIETALQTHPELVKKYFGTVIPAHDNMFSALNTAVWSGGSFVYVPQGVEVTMPLQAYFRIDQQKMGQFERTLIVAESGSSVHYVEGCSAPVHRAHSLHSAVVELIAHQGATIRYTTIQNWSQNVYNLVTKRAIAYKDAKVMWVDGNFGSKVTMKYPSIILKESGASGQVISIAVAGEGQHQDTGAKIIHVAPNTHSSIVSKSISKHGGRTSYRGLLKVAKGAMHVKARVQCDALLLDELSRTDTYPTVTVFEEKVDVGHEASVGYLDDEQLFYLMSRGFTKQQASGLLVNGFIDVFVKELPMEYAVEINRLLAHEMEGSIG